jgi:hypothetical protein
LKNDKRYRNEGKRSSFTAEQVFDQLKNPNSKQKCFANEIASKSAIITMNYQAKSSFVFSIYEHHRYRDCDEKQITSRKQLDIGT